MTVFPRDTGIPVLTEIIDTPQHQAASAPATAYAPLPDHADDAEREPHMQSAQHVTTEQLTARIRTEVLRQLQARHDPDAIDQLRDCIMQGVQTALDQALATLERNLEQDADEITARIARHLDEYDNLPNE